MIIFAKTRCKDLLLNAIEIFIDLLVVVGIDRLMCYHQILNET